MLPFPLTRIEQAQDWMLRIGPVRVMMRNCFVRVLRAAREQRLKHSDPRSYRQNLRGIEIASDAVKDLDQIGLMEGAQSPLPGDHPARLAADLKARPKLTH